MASESDVQRATAKGMSGKPLDNNDRAALRGAAKAGIGTRQQNAQKALENEGSGRQAR